MSVRRRDAPSLPSPACEGGNGEGRSALASGFTCVTPQLDDTAALAREVDATLGAADIAAVLLRLADSDERTLINRAKTIAAIVQRRDVAVLIDGHPRS